MNSLLELLLPLCVTSGRLLALSVTHFPLLSSEDNDDTQLAELP